MSIYDFNMISIEGWNRPLSEYRDKVILIVNTASKCGFTPQYKGLQKLYDDYKEKGFVILGFPANDFLRQEPGTNEEIKEFCSVTYNITFPMFEKIHVKGKEIHPLYKYLTAGGGKEEFAGKISWNFTKFLINRQGEVIARFAPKDDPEKIRPYIEEAL
ncbi:Glutathione peroxidase [Mesotoga infera]|uniref:Glutathione peroxidase n=1 Tax=Mesotoga infera TaxID=1236046 RepID=A0A7Z7PS38_9BACT|nr:glutathione peroxidase [Mesotoga infera]SSC14082.1 Glutathione peroxidase [Mesotoga infera]